MRCHGHLYNRSLLLVIEQNLTLFSSLVPRHFLLGGAVEIAGVLHSLGTQTHLFVRKSKPLRTFDPYIIDTLVDIMAKEGPTLHTECSPKEVVKEADGSLTIHFENGYSENVDQVIWAIGRTPTTDKINLALMLAAVDSAVSPVPVVARAVTV